MIYRLCYYAFLTKCAPSSATTQADKSIEYFLALLFILAS